MSIELVMKSNHLILYHSLLFLPSIFPSIRVFSNKSAIHISWPRCWDFSFSISPSNEYSGLISLGLTGLILLFREPSRVFSSTTVQFFSTQRSLWSNSHSYMATGKTIVLTGHLCPKGMSLLFNKLSRLVIIFLPRSKHLVISWLQSLSAVILEPRE